MRTLAVIMIAALVALPLTGCIENMDDLKDRLQRSAATDTPSENVTPGGATGNLTNVTGPEWKPPVARISVFEASGALAYKADFEAANVTAPVIIAPGDVSLVAGESEVLEANATLVAFEWTVDGESYEGRQATVPITEPGVYMIVLTVTDSKNSTDSQMVHVGVLPEPFTVTEEIEGGAAAGADAASSDAGQPSSIEFTVLSEQDGKPLKVQEIKVTGSAENPLVDTILVVTSPSGTATSADGAFVQAADGAESVVLAGGDAGVWTATLRMFAGATPSWTATVEVTYVQDVPELAGGDGHGGHAH